MLCILPSYCTLLDLPKRSASHQQGALVSPATSLGHQHSCHSPSKQHHAATLTQPGHTTSPAAQSLKTMSSGSPFKCCTNSYIYTLFRESSTLIHTLPISWQSLIIHSDTNQVSNMLFICYSYYCWGRGKQWKTEYAIKSRKLYLLCFCFFLLLIIPVCQYCQCQHSFTYQIMIISSTNFWSLM